MNTPTHFLMTAAVRKAMPALRMPKSAVLIGSVAPDVPLYLLSFGGFLYFHNLLGWSMRDAGRHIYGYLYFNDPGWIAFHSLLHSPVSLLLGFLLVQQIRSRAPRFAHWMNWFLAACLLHSIVDILTHFDDGPVLLWPLEWHFRFHSPVSYWDAAHFGREFFFFEATLAVALGAYVGVPWLWKRVFVRLRAEES